MFRLPFYILLINVIAVFSAENLCPSPEDTQPCYCVSDGETIRMDCMSVESVEEIRKALASTKGIQNVYVDFLRAKLDNVPSDLFKGLHITKVSFTNCELGSYGEEGKSALEGLEDIIQEFSIHFSFTEDHELQFLNVSGLHKLEDLQLEGNGLTTLNNDWFKDGPMNLRNLFLMTNFIEELGDKAFSSLKNIVNLWVTGNRFKVVKRSMFPYPAKFLTSLDLADNGILSLPEDMFSEMPSLKEVVLAENGITRIPSPTWMPVWKQLTRLYLEMNPLECDSHIKWMFKVPRPFVLKGTCTSPKDRKNQNLKTIIDENAEEEDDYDYEITL